MTYASVVQADSPTNWWRCVTPGPNGVMLNSVPGRPALFDITSADWISTQQQMSGIANDGGSYLIRPGDSYNGGIPCFVAPCVGIPYTFEAWTWTQLAVWNTSGSPGMLRAGANGSMATIGISGVGFPVWRTTGSGSCSGNPASSAYLAVGAWVHQAVTMTGTTARYFVNGVQTDSCTFTASNPAAFDGAGVGSGQGIGVGFNVCEIATYATALTAAELLAHYDAADRLAAPAWRNGLAGVCN